MMDGCTSRCKEILNPGMQNIQDTITPKLFIFSTHTQATNTHTHIYKLSASLVIVPWGFHCLWLVRLVLIGCVFCFKHMTQVLKQSIQNCRSCFYKNYTRLSLIDSICIEKQRVITQTIFKGFKVPAFMHIYASCPINMKSLKAIHPIM